MLRGYHVKNSFSENPKIVRNLTLYSYEPVDPNNGNDVSRLFERDNSEKILKLQNQIS